MMDKYGQADDDMITDLRNEEAQLMTEVAGYMTRMDKTADEQRKFSELEGRLQAVRNKITDIDLKKAGRSG